MLNLYLYNLWYASLNSLNMGYFVSNVFRPVIEMCIPSVLDPTLAPDGCHVASLFTQYTPYTLSTGPWTEQDKEAYASTG